MSDAAVRQLARLAGVAVDWTDYTESRRRVSVEVLRHILSALGLPCSTSEDLSYSRHKLSLRRMPPLITGTAGTAVDLPIAPANPAPRARLVYEDGTKAELATVRTGTGLRLPAIDVPGYHAVEIGEERITLAVAPRRCLAISDIAAGTPIWGLAAQVYGLRSRGDCGIGDMAGVAALARSAASFNADALALSPTHAPLTAAPYHFSPYAPSSRLFYNPLHANARSLFGEERWSKAIREVGNDSLMLHLEQQSQIDWPASARFKMAAFRRLFEDFSATDLAASSITPLAADFADFRSAGGTPLQDHARFEAVHAARLHADPSAWSWIDWPAVWRDPHSTTVTQFAETHAREVLFHCFLQWLAARSLAAAQRAAKRSGMRIGLVADLAVGVTSAGSDAWISEDNMLGGLEIGAPPDLFNPNGQNWGITTFSPHALAASGFAPFLAMLRAGLCNVGGMRIDHAMGLLRLWVIPRGASAREGAYLSYPVDDLLRLIALESHRNRAIVIGEDLGTVPPGFLNRLAAAAIYGLRVLWFERRHDDFLPPGVWSANAAAMTSTHDLPTVAGWWRGRDVEVRSHCGLIKDDVEAQSSRSRDRENLWNAFRVAEVGDGPPPTLEEAPRVVSAAVKFLTRTPTQLALLPLEDALALEDQPNVPGTTDEYPNWCRRYPGDAAELLDRSDVTERLEPLRARARR